MTALMFLGTGSHVGKSTMVAGLCRILANRGIKVAPFKPQNMSNNAAVTQDGGEVGRAQALQAFAARVPLSVHMNPVLLKPQADNGSQVIVQGKRLGYFKAREYFNLRDTLKSKVMQSYEFLKSKYDLILVEGAGSAAETNLRRIDIANLGFAQMAKVPCVIIGDIDRGGVIASLVGTHAVLNSADRHLICGFIINQMRGDASLFNDGMRKIQEMTGWGSIGLVPYMPGLAELPAEDSQSLFRQQSTAQIHNRQSQVKVTVLHLPRIANFDDFDPLKVREDVEMTFLNPDQVLPTDSDLVIIPGSKSVIADMQVIRHCGWEVDLLAYARRGGHILGICGGYQMLGNAIHDTQKIEGETTYIRGLGLLQVETELTSRKELKQVTAVSTLTGKKFTGYEIHLGETKGPDSACPFSTIEGKSAGALSKNRKIMGTYVHGLFNQSSFTESLLELICGKTVNVLGENSYEDRLNSLLNDFSRELENHIDVDALVALAQ